MAEKKETKKATKKSSGIFKITKTNGNVIQRENLETEIESLEKENSDLRKLIHHLVEGDK